jgi:hypothetical protein
MLKVSGETGRLRWWVKGPAHEETERAPGANVQDPGELILELLKRRGAVFEQGTRRLLMMAGAIPSLAPDLAIDFSYDWWKRIWVAHAHELRTTGTRHATGTK